MNHLYTQYIIVLLIALAATAYLVPKISSIVKFKRLMDDPNVRSSHAVATPSLGGMAFFIVLIISLYFNYSYDQHNISMSLIPGLTILLFLGLKDDLVILSARTKLVGQIAASLFVLVHAKLQISSFHGFFGVGEVHSWVGFGVALFIMLAVINSLNLIDGIDGLAASIGIVAFSGFAVMFFIMDRHFLALTSVTMVGILGGFLFFNLSSKRKIFMGDTGSMIIGFMLGVFSVRFLAMETSSLHKLPFNPVDVPIMVAAFLIIPIYDTTRVFIIRLLNKKGPFSPDRNHLHHVLIDGLGISHRRASFCIALANVMCVIIIGTMIKFTNFYISITVIGGIIAGFTWYLSVLKNKRRKMVVRRLKHIRRYNLSNKRKLIGTFPGQELGVRTRVS